MSTLEVKAQSEENLTEFQFRCHDMVLEEENLVEFSYHNMVLEEDLKGMLWICLSTMF